MKSHFIVHTNGQDEWIRVDKRTYEKAIDKFCDAHEAKLTKACEILDGANLVEIERHFAECKAKDERIAELEAQIKAIKEYCREQIQAYDGPQTDVEYGLSMSYQDILNKIE